MCWSWIPSLSYRYLFRPATMKQLLVMFSVILLTYTLILIRFTPRVVTCNCEATVWSGNDQRIAKSVFFKDIEEPAKKTNGNGDGEELDDNGENDGEGSVEDEIEADEAGLEETIAPDNNITKYNYSQFLNETQSLRMYIEYLKVNDFYAPWEFNRSATGALRRMIVRRANVPEDLFFTQNNTKVGYHYGYTNAYWTKFKIAQNMFDSFPKKIPESFRNLRKCSVVGPNTILKTTSCGKQIDRSDFVFRYNFNYPGRYVSDIGRKHSLTVIGPSIIKSWFQGLVELKDRLNYIRNVTALGGYLAIPMTTSGMATLGMKAKRLMRNETLIFNPQTYRAFKTILTERYNHSRQLSTGMFTSMVALSLCREVHLYGVWPYRNDYKGVPVPFYFSEETRTGYNVGEYKILRELHEHGGLRLHLGPCT